ncbi:hypothetical protein D3C83_94560 [compost metagenome]
MLADQPLSTWVLGDCRNRFERHQQMQDDGSVTARIGPNLIKRVRDKYLESRPFNYETQLAVLKYERIGDAAIGYANVDGC